MSRFLAGEASQAEAEELHLLVAQSPEKQYLLEILHSYFTNLSAGAADSPVLDPDLDTRFLKMVERAGPDVPDENYTGRLVRWTRERILRYAAVAAAFLALSWGAFTLFHRTGLAEGQQPVKGGEVLSAAGARTRLVLPDGTRVWLNSNSKLKYAHNFNQLSREVELEGEAYFDVIKDAQHPFIVHTSAIDVKVLGTVFTVKCYPQDETIETTLLKGSVEVSRQDKLNSPRVILKPDEKLVFNRHLAATPLAAGPAGPAKLPSASIPADISVNSIPKNIPDSDKVETAWMYNRLVFNGDGFKEVAQKMERWYNVRIVFKDDHLYRCRIGGTFANESVEEALNALQLTTAFTYKIRGNEIELYGK